MNMARGDSRHSLACCAGWQLRARPMRRSRWLSPQRRQVTQPRFRAAMPAAHSLQSANSRFVRCQWPFALLVYPDWVHRALGFVILMFIYGMIDITLSIRDIIIQALTMTRKEAALATRFEQQAKRFDIALNNMSHGLCMLDEQNRLQVWNERFLELLHLHDVPVRVGMRASQLIAHSIRAGNHRTKSVKKVFNDLAHGLQQNRFDQVQTSPDGDRTIAVSRRTMAGGGSVVILEDVTESKRAQERITHLAKYDELTGLANRNQFRERINSMLSAMHRRENRIAIHLIDLDRFKAINDTLGHPIGDKLLKEVASRLKTVIRPGDMITRFGGDEFVVLQAGTERLSGCQVARAASRQDTQGSVRYRRPPHRHWGLDRYRHGPHGRRRCRPTVEEGRYGAIRGQERRWRRSSVLRSGNGTGGTGTTRPRARPARSFVVRGVRTGFPATGRSAHRPRNDLRGTPTLVPSDARNGAAVGVHPDRRRNRPDYRARRMGLASRMPRSGEWPKSVKVAVNLSPVQFRDRGLALQVVSALAKSGFPAQRLELEVTERFAA